MPELAPKPVEIVTPVVPRSQLTADPAPLAFYGSFPHEIAVANLGPLAADADLEGVKSYITQLFLALHGSGPEDGGDTETSE